MSLGGTRTIRAGTEEVSLQPSRQVAAIFDCPLSSRTELLGPGQQGQVIGGSRAEGAFAELASGLVDGDDRVAALVRVNSVQIRAGQLILIAGYPLPAELRLALASIR
jgi:hypothetical protein